MHSLSRQHKNFYYFLGGILFLHAAFMLVQIREHFEITWDRPEAIKIKLVQEVLKESLTKHQIVRSEDSEFTEKKEDAFLSDKDRSFDRQTVAKNIDTFKKAAKGNAATTQVAQKPQVSRKKSPSLNDLKLSDFGMTSGEPVPKEVTRSPASVTQKGMENGDPTSQGLSATNDYVEEVQLGDFTHLNTVEYKFYGFFHRIRQKLEQFWGNSIQEKSQALFKSGRRMLASQDLVTSLQVTLNEKGEIIAVKILGASGVKELDDAAVESFNQAGPFPNPPKELLVNGKATIQWGFVVKS
ncbi:MAG: energy transducer TonB [Bacteriovoracia bacterium]